MDNLSFKDGTTNLAFTDRDGDKLPILFLHGSGFCRSVFQKQFESAALQDHRLLAVDLPGHGNSPNAVDPVATYSYEGMSQAVLNFLEQQNIGSCLVVGWSLGGQVALELLDISPRIAGIMAFGAPPAPNGPLGIIRTMHFSRKLLLAGKAEYSHQDAEMFEQACLGELAKGDFIKSMMRVDPVLRGQLSKSLFRDFSLSQQARVQMSNTPVCLLHGRQDPFIRLNYMQSVQGHNLYTGETIVLDDAGHAPFYDQPDLFNTLLLEFVDAIESGKLLGDSMQSFEAKIA